MGKAETSSGNAIRIRIPIDIRTKLLRAAKRAGRSLNAEVAYRLRASFGTGATDAERLDRIEATLQKLGIGKAR